MQVECAIAFLAVTYSLLGDVTIPVLQVGKSGDSSLLLLLAWPVDSGHPGLWFQYTQMGKKSWYGYFHLQGCGWRQANNEQLGYNNITSQYSPAWTKMVVHSFTYTSKKKVLLLTWLLPVPRTELRSVAIVHLLSFFPF